jgi:hypothetical protein
MIAGIGPLTDQQLLELNVRLVPLVGAVTVSACGGAG